MCNETDANAVGDVASVTVQVVLWLVFDGTFCIIIVSGNLITLYVLRSSLSPLASSQFIMSLALSDMVVGTTIPYHMTIILLPWLAQNRITCVLKFVFILFGCCASILNLTAIAADRYFTIVHPFTYERMMNTRLARTVVCGSWLNAVIFSTVPLYWNSWQPGMPCELGRVLPRYYTIAVLMPAFLVIWATMFIIYLRIWREAVQQRIKIRQSLCKLRKSSFQVVLLIMGCFTICWFPFLIVVSVQAAGRPDLVSPTMYKAVLTLAISSSAVNPLIYAWKNAEFKRTFGHIKRRRTASHSVQYERSSTEKYANRSSSLFVEAQTNRSSIVFHEVQTNIDS